MSTHYICFYGEIDRIILELSELLLFNKSPGITEAIKNCAAFLADLDLPK